MPPKAAANGPLPPLKILFLHGYTQTSVLFAHKTGALTKAIRKAFPHRECHFSYPSGPHRLDPADVPGAVDPSAAAPESANKGSDTGKEGKEHGGDEIEYRAWWRRKDRADPITGANVIEYEGLEEGLEAVAQTIEKEGPFDGVVGFSQGGCAAALVASLLEEGRHEKMKSSAQNRGERVMSGLRKVTADGKQGPLRFAVAYSGFKAPGERFSYFYQPKITTPVLHVLGAVDVVVEEARSKALIEVCEGGDDRVVIHPGGHFVPSQRRWLDAVVGFIRDQVEKPQSRGPSGLEDEKVEDMDVPF